MALDYFFDEVEMAIAAADRGDFVLLVDDEHRKNEGDRIIATDAVTPVHLAFMVRTLRSLADPGSVASDFVRPGHIFPLRGEAGRVLERPAHTEVAHDPIKLGGRSPGGVGSELVYDDGTPTGNLPFLPHCTA